MTLRLDYCVVKGELDCRTPGKVTGRLWLNGWEHPVELDLEGTAMRDLSGHLVQFTCKGQYPAQPEGIHRQQTGRLGRCTASVKRNVPKGTGQEVVLQFMERIPFTWHTEVFLVLEWMSDQDGHLILEAPFQELQLLERAEWTLTEEEEQAQVDAWVELMRRDSERELTLIIPEFGEEDEDASRPEEEKIADEEDARMETLLDRVHARLEAIDGAETPEEYERIYREEREKLRKERGEPEPVPPTPEEVAERERMIDEMNETLSEAFETMEEEWEEIEDHPLAERCMELSEKIFDDLAASGWVPDEAEREHPFRELQFGVQFAAAKLVGGLNTLDGEWPPPDYAIGGVLVRLKKAREYLRDALRSLHSAEEQNLGMYEWRQAVQLEVNELHLDVIEMIQQLRELSGG